jgi:hypothetical protein
MDAIRLLRLKQLRFEAASQLVLREWHPENLSKLKCLKCFGQVFLTPNQSEGKQLYYCARCNRYSQQVSSGRICDCVLPGQHTVCHGCPNFDHFMELINQRLPELECLSPEELQRLISQKLNL